MYIKVTVAFKPADHPFYNRGSKYCFYINGVPGKLLELKPGEEYTFSIDAPGHPFYFTSSDRGGSDDKNILGGVPPTDRGIVKFTMLDSYPESFYYQCKIHSFMGGYANKSHNTFYITPILRGLVAPTSLCAAKGDSSTLYIADQIGLVYKYNLDIKDISIFLDVREYIPMLNENYEERGLLGLCMHNEFLTNGRFFIYYSSRRERKQYNSYNFDDALYYNCLSEFTYKDGKILYEAEKVILRLNRDSPYHNGGKIGFGPDGYMYIAIGDHGPQMDTNNNAQNLEILAGKILRIDVDNINNFPYYRIPPDNPFIDLPSARPEIWAYGFRNPWGLEFVKNNQSDDSILIVTDAGYESGSGQEEVNIVVKGGNYGWNIKHGKDLTPWTEIKDAQLIITLIDPIFSYTTSDSKFADSDVSVIVGGYLTDSGDYICADYSGRLIRLRFNINGAQVIETASVGKWIRSFGKVDRYTKYQSESQLYMLTSELSGPKGKTGEIYAIKVE